jgi:hypothetical protein
VHKDDIESTVAEKIVRHGKKIKVDGMTSEKLGATS